LVIKALDPDRYQPKILDLDPDEMNADPQPWFSDLECVCKVYCVQVRMAGLQQAPVNLIQQAAGGGGGGLPPQALAFAQRTVLQPHNLIVQQPRPAFIQAIQQPQQQQILRQVGAHPWFGCPRSLAALLCGRKNSYNQIFFPPYITYNVILEVPLGSSYIPYALFRSAARPFPFCFYQCRLTLSIALS
jgi:hypothetical protein